MLSESSSLTHALPRAALPDPHTQPTKPGGPEYPVCWAGESGSEGSREMTVEIALFRPEHANRFAQLNREWLEEYNLMEPANEEQLADPEAHFVVPGEQCLAYARERGAERVFLVSNSQLQAALGLYESFGFKYGPVPEVKEYENRGCPYGVAF